MSRRLAPPAANSLSAYNSSRLNTSRKPPFRRGLYLIHDRDSPITLTPHALSSILGAGQLVVNLRRHTTSWQALYDGYRYQYPRAIPEEIELLVAADRLLGHPDHLTIEQARRVVAEPPELTPTAPFRRRA